MNMSERIKERRNAVGLTQEELGEKLGLKKSAIAKYENGRVENIKRSTIQKMAVVLECSPSYLLGFEPEYTVKDFKPLEKLDPEDIELLRAYYNATKEVQNGIRSILGLKKE